MKCQKCGNEIPLGVKFCPKCGTQVSTNESVDKGGEKPDLTQETKGDCHTLDILKNKVVIAIIGVVAVAALIVGFIVTRPETYDLNKYMTYEIEGHDGTGTCMVSLDTEKISKDMAKTVLKNAKKKGYNLDDLYDEGVSDESTKALIVNYDLAQDWVEVSVNKSKNLSNGDKVTISYKYNNDKLKKYGIKFNGKEKTITVKDLPEVETVDVFKKMKLEFSGISPNAETAETGTSKIGDAVVHYTCEPYENLTIGDELKVTITDISDGYKPKENVGTIKVTNVDAYIQSPEDLSSDNKKILFNNTQDFLDGKKEEDGKNPLTTSSLLKLTMPEDENGIEEDISLYDSAISNISLDKSAKLFVHDDTELGIGESHNFIYFYFECDVSEIKNTNLFGTSENKELSGQTLHCYGALLSEDIINKTDGTLEFEENIPLMRFTPLFTNKEQLGTYIDEDILGSDAPLYTISDLSFDGTDSGDSE